MMELKELFMDVRKELRCADKYAHEAVKHKTEFPSLSDVYHRIAVEKMGHAEMLHRQAHEMAMKHGVDGAWEIEDYMVKADLAELKRCLENYR